MPVEYVPASLLILPCEDTRPRPPGDDPFEVLVCEGEDEADEETERDLGSGFWNAWVSNAVIML